MTVQRVEELLLDMKDTSELMVDLAYSALFYDSKSIAREVHELEEDVGESLYELQRLTLSAVKDGTLGIDNALVMLWVAQSAETIANSALEIADVVLRDVELHPVLMEAIRESDSTITKVTLAAESPFAGKTLRELELETETGMRVLAVKRGRVWESGVDGEFRLEAGDVLVASGPWDAEKEFLLRCDPEHEA
jgi:uncharacterized protein with PhoU and TrkA domain